MKKYLLFFAFLLIGSPAIFAQISPVPAGCGIRFSYDNAGNRVKRYVCLTQVELEYDRQGRTVQVSNEIDLEGMLSDIGFSEEMEAEIEKLEALLAQPGALDLLTEVDKDKKVELTDENFQNLSDMILFPNPTMESFSIKGNGLSPEATVSIVDMNGRVLSQRSLGDGSGIDVSELAEGTYMITLMHKDVRKVSLLVKTTNPY
ncbi:MAG: T9SS type A sorting domain-containing protein [Bacteroidota bacterium]